MEVFILLYYTKRADMSFDEIFDSQLMFFFSFILRAKRVANLHGRLQYTRYNIRAPFEPGEPGDPMWTSWSRRSTPSDQKSPYFLCRLVIEITESRNAWPSNRWPATSSSPVLPVRVFCQPAGTVPCCIHLVFPVTRSIKQCCCYQMNSPAKKHEPNA